MTRAISGHATETMQHHYSSVGAAEKQTAIAKVPEGRQVVDFWRRRDKPLAAQGHVSCLRDGRALSPA